MSDYVIVTYESHPPTFRGFKSRTNAMAYYHSITDYEDHGTVMSVYRYEYGKCVEQRHYEVR